MKEAKVKIKINKKANPRVGRLDHGREKTELVREVSDTEGLEASHSISRHGILGLELGHPTHLSTPSSSKLPHIGNHDEVSGENTLVSGSGTINNLVSQHNIKAVATGINEEKENN